MILGYLSSVQKLFLKLERDVKYLVIPARYTLWHPLADACSVITPLRGRLSINVINLKLAIQYSMSCTGYTCRLLYSWCYTNEKRAKLINS